MGSVNGREPNLDLKLGVYDGLAAIERVNCVDVCTDSLQRTTIYNAPSCAVCGLGLFVRGSDILNRCLSLACHGLIGARMRDCHGY